MILKGLVFASNESREMDRAPTPCHLFVSVHSAALGHSMRRPAHRKIWRGDRREKGIGSAALRAQRQGSDCSRSGVGREGREQGGLRAAIVNGSCIEFMRGITA